MEKGKLIKWLLTVLMLVAAVIALGLFIHIKQFAEDPEPGHYPEAAVSSDGSLCASIAVKVLTDGGTAADAAIAAMFCSGVVNPHSTGVGGGFLLTLYDRAEGRAYTLNARETAPAAATEDMFQGDPSLSQIGGLAVAVPGQVRGCIALYERFGGGVEWASLVAPSISLCEEGHPVSSHLANALQEKRELVLAEPSLSMFVNSSTGDVLQEGDLLFQHALASTLRTLQTEPDALYTGALATQLVQDLTDRGGIITDEDMANYTAEWVDPIQIDLDSEFIPNATLYSVPPPGSGVVLAFILNVLDEYDFDASSADADMEVVTHQRITEAFKYAYAQRTHLGDPKFEDVEERVAVMTSETFARAVRDLIWDNATSQDPRHYGAYTESVDDRGTSHVSVISARGDAVSVTSTINGYLGAMLASNLTGVIYNNEMDDFSSPNITNMFDLPPSPANFIKPGKQPLSSMCPAILVTDAGDVRLALGAAGGSKITSAVALTAVRHLWFSRDLNVSITDPRIHHQLYPMVLSYEQQFSPVIVAGLEEFNHTTEEYPTGGSAVFGVARLEDDSLHAVSDFRKSGQVDGY